MVSISMNEFIFLSPYVRVGVIDYGACSMTSMSNAVCRKIVSFLTCGNGFCCGKNSIVAVSRTAPVAGMKYLKHI